MRPTHRFIAPMCAAVLLAAAACSTRETPEPAVEATIASLNADIHRRSISNVHAVGEDRSLYVWASHVPGPDAEQPFRSYGSLSVRLGGGAVITVKDDEAHALVDPETPPQVVELQDGALLVAWSATDDSESVWQSTGIRVARSTDAGSTWSAPVTATGAFGGYQNNHELHVTADGTVYLAWLDSRFAAADERAIHVLMSRSDDGGLTWSDPVLVDADPSCECCRVAVASDKDGSLLVAWRKRLDGGIRDIVVARSDDRGATWSEPNVAHHDDWVQSFCPDAGPSMLVDPTGVLHVAWWTGRESVAGVRYARSTDGGQTFEEPVVLSNAHISRASHVQLAHNGRGTVVAVWDEGALDVPQIALGVSRDNGIQFEEVHYLSPEGAVAAYPHAQFVGSQLEVVWNRRGDGDNPSRSRAEGDGWIELDGSSGPAILRARIDIG